MLHGLITLYLTEKKIKIYITQYKVRQGVNQQSLPFEC